MSTPPPKAPVVPLICRNVSVKLPPMLTLAPTIEISPGHSEALTAPGVTIKEIPIPKPEKDEVLVKFLVIKKTRATQLLI